MPSRSLLTRSAAVIAIIFVGIQFYQPYSRDNPAEVQANTLYGNIDVPPNIKAIMERSCFTCHSYRTKWPWYAYIAPTSWLVARDVDAARKAVNFSDWTKGAGRNPGLAASMLATSCMSIREDRMPVIAYAFMHPESRPTKQEILDYCAWATNEMKAQIKKKRELDRSKMTTAPVAE